MRLITSWRTPLAAKLATRPVSSRRSSLERAAVLRVLVGLLRWRLAKGEEDLRRMRGLVVLGILDISIPGGI